MIREKDGILIGAAVDSGSVDIHKPEPTPEQKAKWKAAAAKAIKTKKIKQAFIKSKASEAASKAAFRAYCEQKKWKVAFFEGIEGAPRNGIIDAFAYRLAKSNPDALEIRLVQLKGGKAGVTGLEIKRLKEAVNLLKIDWIAAMFDGETLHILPEDQTV